MSLYGYFAALCIFIAILPYLPDSLFLNFPLNPESYDMPQTEMFFKKVKWNTLISDKATTLVQSQIIGPESLVSKGNFIYTGLGDGRIVAIHKENHDIKTIATLKSPDAEGCDANIIKNVSSCGRPLGMRLADDGKLYFIDASKGLYLLDLEENRIKHIALGPNAAQPLQGLFNDIVMDPRKPEIVYVSTTSFRWPMGSIIWSLLEMRNDGAILAVNTKTGQFSKILDGLHKFYNGLEISPDKKSLLIAITGEFKVIKVDLADIDEALAKGEPIQSVQTFIDNLPGMPDNIRLFGNDLYIALPMVRLNSTLMDTVSKLPKVRKIIGRLANLIDRLITFITEKIYSFPKLTELGISFRNGHIIHALVPSPSGILIVDANTGKPKRILGCTQSSISEALLDPNSGDLYLGSYRHPYILKIKSRDLK